jgi:serine/threonine protein kinase
MNLATGRAIGGRYEIIHRLGKGGFGATFLARDRHLPGDRFCVVKQLKPQAQDPDTLKAAQRLFETEAEVLDTLGNHPRIPHLFAYFTEDKEFYLVQEYIAGDPLSKELVEGKKYDEKQVRAWLKEILEILEFVHQNNVIHRDINPQNILVRESDKSIFLIDFGAVKQINTTFMVAEGMNLTVSIGTPGYHPSEQANGSPKFSSDIYAVGIVAIQALTGLSPQQIPIDPDTEELIWRDRADVSSRLADFLDRMVRYDFRQRFYSATEALKALAEIDNSELGTVVISPQKVKNKKHRQNRQKPIKPFPLVKIGLGIGCAIAIALGVTQLNNLQAADRLSKEGETLAQLKKYPEALESYQKALKIKPDSVAAWVGKANILTQLQKYKEALSGYEQAIKIQPEAVAAWQGRGYVLLILKQNDRALDSFNQALQIDGNVASSWRGKGKVFTQTKKYAEALSAYDEATKLDAKALEVWYERGWILHNLRRYDDAIASYDKALSLQDSLAPAWYGKANSFAILGKDGEAIAAYQKAVDYQPNYYQAWFGLGNILLKQQQCSLAVNAFDRGLKYESKNREIWASQGWALHQLGQYKLAVSAYNRSLSLKRSQPQIWYNKGNALYNLSNYEAAAFSYRKATRYQNSYYQAWYSHGNALVKLKRYPEAIKSYQKALRDRPNYPEAIAALNWAKLQGKVIDLQNRTSPSSNTDDKE